jgi:shikimate dehydrogenase
VDVIVNATYLGMKDDDPLPIPASCLEANMVVCDAVYRPGGETGLIRLAKERGLLAVPGERMLLYQGVQAQRMWTGKEPDVAAMSDALA